MKKLQTILMMMALLVASSKLIAQAPQGIPYQAVARDASGNLVTNQNVSMRFSIHDAAATGTVVYKETHSATTNSLGLFNVKIGGGTVVSGTFSAVPWGTGSKFLQVEMDPAGGTSYIDMGTTEMTSVPYALHAATADAVNETDPQVGSTTPNKVPKWNGTTLTDGTIFDNGTNVGIGTASPNAGAALDISSTTGSLLVPRLTQAQRNALSPVPGMIIHNTTNNTTQAYTFSTITDINLSQTYANNYLCGNQSAAQSFVPTVTGSLYSVTVMNESGSSGTGTLLIRQGIPLGGPIMYAQPVTISASSPGSEAEFVLTNPPMLNSGSLYSFEFTGPSCTWYWRFSTNNYYTGGNLYFFGTSYPANDLYFKIKMTTSTLGWTAFGGGTEGPVGGTGPVGPQGPQGPAGPVATGLYAATSSTVNFISTGMHSFTTQTGLAYLPGMRARVASNVSPTNFIEGIVTSYSGTFLVINVDITGGSGTFSSWNIGIAGEKGATGATGPQGTAAPTYSTTSTTSVTMGTGNKVFSVPAGLPYFTGLRLRVVYSFAPTTFMEGVVNSYSGTTLIVNVDLVSGSGTGASWNIGLAGEEGVQGPVGPAGPAGSANISGVSNQLVKFTGSASGGNSIIHDNGTNIGISNSSPAQKLDVNGTVKSTGLQMTAGAAAGRVLQSDASGNASWVNPNTITTNEIDPKVQTGTPNAVTIYDGQYLVDGNIYDNNGNIGIGTTNPSTDLDVIGTVKASNLRMVTGAGAGKLLMSDASGNAAWTAANTITVNETDPQIGTITVNNIPRWNGSALVDGSLTEIGGNIGVGTASPGYKLDVNGTTRTSGLLLTANAGTGKVLQSDASGNATWSNNISTIESDPQVSSSVTNKVSKWNGTSLTDGNIFDNGNVGIGTTSPRGGFDVAGTGDIWLTNSGTNSGTQSIYLPGHIFITPYSGTNISYLQARRSDNTGTTSLRVRTYNSGAITEALQIEGNGNVGIGTITPAQKLEVIGTTKTTELQVTDLSGTGSRYVMADANGNLSANATTAVTMTSLTGPQTMGVNTSASIINTPVSGLSFQAGDVLVIEVMITVRYTGGSNQDEIWVQPILGGAGTSGLTFSGGGGNAKAVKFQPGESAADHNNPNPLSIIEYATCGNAGSISTLRLDMWNWGDDLLEYSNIVYVVRKL